MDVNQFLLYFTEGSGDFDDTLTDMEDAISVTSNGKSTTDISITKVNATGKVIKATTNIPHESSKINDIDDEDRVQGNSFTALSNE